VSRHVTQAAFHESENNRLSKIEGEAQTGVQIGEFLGPQVQGSPPAVCHSSCSDAVCSTFKGQEFREPVTAGDLIGDGIADLVFSNRLAQRISIYLGNGGGTFTRRVRWQHSTRSVRFEYQTLTATGFPIFSQRFGGAPVVVSCGFFLGRGTGPSDSRSRYKRATHPPICVSRISILIASPMSP
jgi:hypothetical protein